MPALEEPGAGLGVPSDLMCTTHFRPLQARELGPLFASVFGAEAAAAAPANKPLPPSLEAAAPTHPKRTAPLTNGLD